MFWNRQDLLLMMGTEIFKIDASWVEKLTKTSPVQSLFTPTVFKFFIYLVRQVSTGRAAGSYSLFLQPWRSYTSDVDAASEVITIRECHYVW